jgi:hypothetical protein
MAAEAVAVAPIVAPVVVPIKSRKLHPARFAEAAQSRNVWAATPTHDTKYEDLFAPEYWAHIAVRARPGDFIEVFAEDGSYWAQLIVLSAGRQALSVAEIQRRDLQRGNALPEAGSGVIVEWKGPHLKYCVLRTKDNERVSEKHESRLQAENAAAEYLKVLAR